MTNNPDSGSGHASVDRARFGWVRRASAVAMARGGRGPWSAGSAARADLRMGGAGARFRPGLWVEAMLSRR